MGSIVLGIDVGLSGALCFLDEVTNSIRIHDMPLCEGRNGDAVEVDFPKLAGLLVDAKSVPRIIAIEDVWGHAGQGGKSSFTFGAAYGAVVSACALSRVRTVRVLPRTWQTSILGKTDAGDTKDASRAWCLTRYAREHFIRGAGRKPSHDRCDATCIARFASKTWPEGVSPADADRTRKGDR